MKPTILVIHTENASRRKHFEKARRYDARLVLIKKNPKWEAQWVDAVYDVDTTSIAATVAAVLDIAKKEKIDGVVTLVEHSVPSAAAAAAALGLPFVSETTANLARNKYEMRRAYQRAGIKTPNLALAATLDEGLAFAKSNGYPLVLKPLIGGGSMFVRRVNNEGEMREWFEYIRRGAWEGFDYDPLYRQGKAEYKGAILLEEYVHGGEISVESVVVGGKTHVLAICDKPLPMFGPFFEEEYFYTPSRLSPEYQAKIVEQCDQAHRALGIEMGATHNEFRTTEQGPVILETAARMGGGPIYRVVLFSTGVDMVDAVMDLSLGKTPDLTPRHHKIIGSRDFFAEKQGRVVEIRGMEALATMPGVLEVDVYKQLGDEVRRAPDAFQSHGHFILEAPDYATLDQRVADGLATAAIIAE